jgi:hypothetical protein
MKLATSLVVISCSLAAGVTIFAFLGSLPRYERLSKRLTLVVILCALLAAGATAAKEILAEPFQGTNGPNGAARKATSKAFDAAIEKLVNQAKAHFEAAENDFENADYVDADANRLQPHALRVGLGGEGEAKAPGVDAACLAELRA